MNFGKFIKNERIRKEQGIKENEFYHYDTPCTINNQSTMLKKAGFQTATKVFRTGNTSIFVATQ